MEMKIAAGGSVNGISSSHLEDSSLLISGTSNGFVNCSFSSLYVFSIRLCFARVFSTLQSDVFEFLV